MKTNQSSRRGGVNPYVSPTLTSYEIAVEKGFAASGPEVTGAGGSVNDYTEERYDDPYAGI